METEALSDDSLERWRVDEAALEFSDEAEEYSGLLYNARLEPSDCLADPGATVYVNGNYLGAVDFYYTGSGDEGALAAELQERLAAHSELRGATVDWDASDDLVFLNVYIPLTAGWRRRLALVAEVVQQFKAAHPDLAFG